MSHRKHHKGLFFGATAFVFIGGPLCVLASSAPTTRSEVVSSRDSLTLAFPGKEGPVDYESFGKFEDLGTPLYRYTINDRPPGSCTCGGGRDFPEY